MVTTTSRRSIAGLLLAGLLTVLTMTFALGATPAHAVEGEGESHFYEYEEIRENASDVSTQFLDPDAESEERPGFFDWFIFPLAAVGVLITAFILFQYLVFQPRFARESEQRGRR